MTGLGVHSQGGQSRLPCVITQQGGCRSTLLVIITDQLEVLDDLHDLGADTLLGLHSGSADVSGRIENVPVAHF